AGLLALAGVLGVGEGHLLHRKALRVKSADFAKSGSLFQSFLNPKLLDQLHQVNLTISRHQRRILLIHIQSIISPIGNSIRGKAQQDGLDTTIPDKFYTEGCLDDL
ncbi:hypothetical protein KUC69_06200, partial [Pseudomonas aeruginosa]